MANQSICKKMLFEQRKYHKQLKYGVILIIAEMIPLLLAIFCASQYSGAMVVAHYSLSQLQSLNVINATQANALVQHARNANGFGNYNLSSQTTVIVMNPSTTMGLRMANIFIASFVCFLIFLLILLFVISGYYKAVESLAEDL